LSSELYGTAPEIIAQVQPHLRTVPPVRLDLKAADVYSLGCSIKQLLNCEPFKLQKSEDETEDGSLKQGSVVHASEVFAIFNLLDGRLDKALPSVDTMMEDVSEGVPRRCVEIVRACLHLSAPERPSPEDVAAVFQKAYDDTFLMDSSRSINE
jgi:serine/threonine protein kinase